MTYINSESNFFINNIVLVKSPYQAIRTQSLSNYIEVSAYSGLSPIRIVFIWKIVRIPCNQCSLEVLTSTNLKGTLWKYMVCHDHVVILVVILYFIVL